MLRIPDGGLTQRIKIVKGKGKTRRREKREFLA